MPRVMGSKFWGKTVLKGDLDVGLDANDDNAYVKAVTKMRAKEATFDYAAVEKKMFEQTMVKQPPGRIDLDAKDAFTLGKPFSAPLQIEEDPATPKGIFSRYGASEYLVYYPRHQQDGDYSENTLNPGELEYTNFRSLLARFFISCHTNFGRVPNWREHCIGVISYCQRDGGGCELHMPMFDYDGKNIKTHVKKRVKALQDKYDWGDAWVYRTKRGLHVYFFTDLIPRHEYLGALPDSGCCKGFRRAAETHSYGTLRVSAKFTKFDIKFEYILRSKKRHPRKMVRKAHLVQELLRLGQECGTHFASLFPQWASFDEDPTEWRQRPAGKKKTGAKARSIKEEEYANMYKRYKGKKIKKMPNTGAAAAVVGTTTAGVFTTTNVITTSSTNNW